MKRHTFVLVAALTIGITLSACGPTPSYDVDGNEKNLRQIGKIFDKNNDS